MCTCVFVYRVCMVTCCNNMDPLVRSEPSNRKPEPDLDSCSLWTQYTGDSKTDSRDDPEIRTNLYSKDQTAIRIQNRIISCVFVLMSFPYLLLPVSIRVSIRIISCDYLIYFTNMITYMTS